MASKNIYELLDNEEKRRYVGEHAPGILCALIGRRASTNPVELIDDAVKTAALLFEKLESSRRNGNGRHPNGHAVEVRPN